MDFGGVVRPFGGKVSSQLMGTDRLQQSYFGGSRPAYDQTRQEYSGLGSGLAQQGQANVVGGVGGLQQAGTQSLQDRQMGMDMSTAGMGIGQRGLNTQGGAVFNARGLAAQNTDSLAQLQLQQALAQQQRAMLTQAASARGGNQAAAMRNAGATAAQMGLQTQQQAAMLRAQEQQARLGRMLGAEQMAAQVGGQQAGLGYGLAGQGLGAAQQSTGMLGGFGAQQAQLGLGQTSAAMGAYGLRNQMDETQLGADRAYESAMMAGNSPLAIASSVLGGVASAYGGKGGR